MSSIKNTLAELDTAEGEALAAEPQEAALERRVLDGDDSVTAEELGTAAGSKFARRGPPPHRTGNPKLSEMTR